MGDEKLCVPWSIVSIVKFRAQLGYVIVSVLARLNRLPSPSRNADVPVVVLRSGPVIRFRTVHAAPSVSCPDMQDAVGSYQHHVFDITGLRKTSCTGPCSSTPPHVLLTHTASLSLHTTPMCPETSFQI
jgi:hypothetical protein